MDLPSRQEIKNNLREIAESAGYRGSTVDFIISVMSTGYYETLLRAIGLVRESNPETAAGINSLLTLAASRMYHAFRGTCPELILRGKTSTKQTLKRGTKVWSGPNFNLYVKEDTILEANQDPSKIILVASSKYVEATKKHKSDRYFVEFLLNDLSEDINLRIYSDQTDLINDNIGTLITPKTNFREHVIDNSDENIFDVTIADYGVRYYMKTPNDQNFFISAFLYTEDINDQVSELVSDAMSDIYRYAEEHSDSNYTYDPYSYDKSDLLDINFSIEKFESYTLEFANRALPRETKEELVVNYNTQVESIYLIRSNSDLINSFRLAFASKISEVGMKFQETFNSSEIPANLEVNAWRPSYPEISSTPFVVFYYIPKDESGLISETEFESYSNSVKYYYLFDNLFCCKGESISSLQIELDIDSIDSVLAQNEINELISTYLDKFTPYISVGKLTSQILKLKSVDEVIRISIKVNGENIPDTGYQAKDFQYFSSDPEKFKLTINIVSQ